MVICNSTVIIETSIFDIYRVKHKNLTEGRAWENGALIKLK